MDSADFCADRFWALMATQVGATAPDWPASGVSTAFEETDSQRACSGQRPAWRPVWRPYLSVWRPGEGGRGKDGPCSACGGGGGAAPRFKRNQMIAHTTSRPRLLESSPAPGTLDLPGSGSIYCESRCWARREGRAIKVVHGAIGWRRSCIWRAWLVPWPSPLFAS